MFSRVKKVKATKKLRNFKTFYCRTSI